LRRRIEREIPFLQTHVFFPENLEVVKMACGESGPNEKESKRLRISNPDIQLLHATTDLACSLYQTAREFQREGRYKMEKSIREHTLFTSSGSPKIKESPQGFSVLVDSSMTLDLSWKSPSLVQMRVYTTIQADSSFASLLQQVVEANIVH